jgi:hypothetical protein
VTLTAKFNNSSVTLTNATTASNGHIASGCTFAVPSLPTGTYLVFVSDGTNAAATTFTIN